MLQRIFTIIKVFPHIISIILFLWRYYKPFFVSCFLYQKNKYNNQHTGQLYSNIMYNYTIICIKYITLNLTLKIAFVRGFCI